MYRCIYFLHEWNILKRKWKYSISQKCFLDCWFSESKLRMDIFTLLKLRCNNLGQGLGKPLELEENCAILSYKLPSSCSLRHVTEIIRCEYSYYPFFITRSWPLKVLMKIFQNERHNKTKFHLIRAVCFVSFCFSMRLRMRKNQHGVSCP